MNSESRCKQFDSYVMRAAILHARAVMIGDALILQLKFDEQHALPYVLRIESSTKPFADAQFGPLPDGTHS